MELWIIKVWELDGEGGLGLLSSVLVVILVDGKTQ